MIPASCPSPVIGRPVADTICLIMIIMCMKVLVEERKELSWTIVSLSDDSKLQAEGANENKAGKIQKKVGQIKKVVGK